MIIDVIDPFDDEAFSQWFVPVHAAEKGQWPEEPGWAEHELRAIYREQHDFTALLAVARAEDGRVLGSLDVSFPRSDNLHLAYLWVSVAPADEGRGAGRTLARYGEDVARRDGRTTLMGRTDEPVGAGSETRPQRFAKAAGYEPARMDARRLLRLDSLAALDDLERDCLPYGRDYEIRAWIGPCPAELVEGRAAVARAMSTDAPKGDLAYEEEVWDEARVRRDEQIAEAMNRDLVATGAVERSTGALVGFSEMSLPRLDVRTAYHGDTIVLHEHRGHRLGMLLKIANLRQLAAHSPATERVYTENAVENGPMIAVNEALGYRLAGNGIAWQKLLG